MLKKFSHIILSVLLLTTTMGMVVSKHFCGGTFVTLKVFSEAKSCCGDSDCCHNENHFFKVQDDFSLPKIIDTPNSSIVDIYGYELFTFGLPVYFEAENKTFVYTDLPPPPKIQKFLALNQTYLL